MAHRVLLVDDVADLRFLLRVVLETDGGFEVVGEAGDGEHAVELAHRTQPDVIVLDLSMPTMDGLEALPRLRELAPASVIVVLSGFEGARLAPSATKLGADAYFEKGTAPTVVLAKLKELLGIESSPLPPPAGVTIVGDADLHAVVAHDVIGPLGTIVGFGATLEERWEQLDDGTRRSLVRRMTSQARDLHAIADNLLSSRGVELDAFRVALEPVAPAALLTDVADAVTPLCGDHPLNVEVSPDLPIVLVDRVGFLQIIVNLVSNAREHAPDHTPIGLGATADGPWVAVEVTDRGPGIPYTDRVRVLEKHVRLARDGRGLGLGLFIASSLARAMGGSLAIADNDGVGTRVVCRLQCADPSD